MHSLSEPIYDPFEFAIHCFFAPDKQCYNNTIKNTIQMPKYIRFDVFRAIGSDFVADSCS